MIVPRLLQPQYTISAKISHSRVRDGVLDDETCALFLDKGTVWPLRERIANRTSSRTIRAIFDARYGMWSNVEGM